LKRNFITSFKNKAPKSLQTYNDLDTLFLKLVMKLLFNKCGVFLTHLHPKLERQHNDSLNKNVTRKRKDQPD